MRLKGARNYRVPKIRKVERFKAGSEKLAALAATPSEIPFVDRRLKPDLTPGRCFSYAGDPTEQAIFNRQLWNTYGNSRSKER